MERKVTKHRRGSAEISLQELLIKIRGWYRYLISKWATIITFSILGGIIGCVFSLLHKPVYVAASTFVLEDTEKNSGLGQFAGLASMFGIDLSYSPAGGIFEGDNILQLYKSQGMIEKTLLTAVDYKGKKQLLIDRFVDFNQLREEWKKNPELTALQFKKPEDRPANSTLGRLQDSILNEIAAEIDEDYLEVAKPDKKLNIIKAEVKAHDEFFAKTFDEQIVKNVNDFYIQTKTRKSLSNVLLLQRKTDSIRTVMNGDVYNRLPATGANFNANHTKKAVPVQRSSFNEKANELILSELIKNLELSKISLEKETPLIQVIDKPKFPLKKNSLTVIQGIVLGILSFGLLTILFLWLKKICSDLIDRAE